MNNKLENYLFSWPTENLNENSDWKESIHPNFLERALPENENSLAKDSRWPGFFPSGICFVTTTNGKETALEKVVGATIVNRFPYIVALSFCTKPLSDRHYVRERFMEILEEGKTVTIQYFEPGEGIDRTMDAITSIDDDLIEKRIEHVGLKTTRAETNDCPVFEDAYMVYEAKMATPGKDFEGKDIFAKPYTDYGSHRIYYLEIEAIQLRKDIVESKSQIHWKSLPVWKPNRNLQDIAETTNETLTEAKYKKGYSAHYIFPGENTTAFEYDKIERNMAVKYLPPLPEDQVEVDNDRARWPCFFPSSVGMITTWSTDGAPNLMPCGSTSILIRHPLCVAICVSYARINARYAPRTSLDTLLKNKKFTCGVPFADDVIVDAIKYAGSVSISEDKDKITNSGLQFTKDEHAPLLNALPVNFRCNIVDIVRLGTHFLLLGEVESIIVRDDVNKDNCITWNSYPDVKAKNGVDMQKAETVS